MQRYRRSFVLRSHSPVGASRRVVGVFCVYRRLSIPRRIIRRFGGETELRAEGAEGIAPERSAAGHTEDVAVRFCNEPGVLREFRFELAFAPAGVTDKSAHHRVGCFQRGLRLFDCHVMLGIHSLCAVSYTHLTLPTSDLV